MAVYRFKLTLFISFVIWANAYSQGRKPLDLNHPINLPGNSVRLDSLLKEISRQSGFIFSYNTRKINHGLRFSFARKSQSLEELLVKIKEKTGLDYSVADNHIILKSVRLQSSPIEVPSAALVAGKKEKSLSITNSNASPVQNSPKVDSSKNKIVNPTKIIYTDPVQPLLKREDPVEKVILSNQVENKDSLKRTEPKKPALNEQIIVKAQPFKKDSSEKKKTAPGKPVAKQKARQYSAFLIKTGVTSDETLYLGPIVQFGIPTFYATVAYKTDFKISLVNWGLGTSFKLGKNTNLNLQITTGNIRKLYDSVSMSSYDTATVHPGIAHRNLIARSNLTKIALLVEKKISSRFLLQGGLTYNLLTTKFSEPPFPDDGKNLCAVKPPYLIANSTNANGDTNVKSWIGAQLSLLYIINFPKRR